MAKPDAVFTIGGIVMGAISVQRGWRLAPDAMQKGTIEALPDANAPGGSGQSSGQQPLGDYKTDALRVAEIRSTTHCSVRQAVAIVDKERAARRAQFQVRTSESGGTASVHQPSQVGASPDGAAEVDTEPPIYTPQQIDGIILLMCARGWSVEQAAKNFRIKPEALRERWWDFASRCTPAQVSAILGVMREKGWTAEETAMRFRIPEEMLLKGMEGDG
ncbi:MAG: hypothetical protein ACYCUV_07460 [Phycisphaerae bacterium]